MRTDTPGFDKLTQLFPHTGCQATLQIVEGEIVDGMIGMGGVLMLLGVLGVLVGALDRERFAPRWLLVAALLVAMNDALLTNLYGLLPDEIGGDWNWQGKLLALGATLVIAALPSFRWRRCGLVLTQNPGSFKAIVPVVALYCVFFYAIAVAFPGGEVTIEDVAFQLTMPGLEEEPFYRGVLLFALDRAFAGRWQFLGVEWGWGAVLSCFLFGMAHAFGFSGGSFSFDPITFTLTAIPSFIVVWLRLKTGSIFVPVLLHNFGNSIGLLV